MFQTLKGRIHPIVLPIIFMITISLVIISAFLFMINQFFEFNEVDRLYYLENTNVILAPHVMSIVLLTVLLLNFVIIINYKLKKADPLEKPKGILLLVEMLVSSIDNFTVDMLGEKLKQLSPYIGFLAIYLFLANTIGLFGLTPPTANLSVTLTFGLTTFILVRYYGIKFKGWEHLLGLFRPLPLFIINIIGELAVPFSLSIRLFGNILSGVIIMALIYGSIGAINDFTGYFVGFTGIVPALHVYFDLFSGLIQTFVFILLTSVFISNASD